MNFHRAKYLLPNLFTLSSICAGTFSIHMSSTAQNVSDITLAAWLIVVSMVCDLLDGRVARLTEAESELGIQLDSLADAISFGVAPAFLLYHWGMTEWGLLGMFVAFGYVGCAVMRLARFNVLAGQMKADQKFFMGLPTPLAAGTVVSVVMAHVSYAETMAISGATMSVAAVTLVLGGLMISNVRYRTFKNLGMSGKVAAVAAVVVLTSAAVSVYLKPSVAFVLLMLAYVVLGLGGGLFHLGKAMFATGGEESPLLAELRDGESSQS